MTPERTPEGKWVLYRGSDGQRIDRWPVDARAMLATGGYTADPPHGTLRPPATVAPGSASPLPDPLPAEYAPGVPLVASAAGVPASPFPASPSPRKRR